MKPLEKLRSKAVAFGSWVKRVSSSPTAIALFAAFVAFVDFVAGPDIRFPITYVAPVALAAWHLRRKLAFVLALALPGLRLWFGHLWREPLDNPTSLFINALIRCAMLMIIATLVSRHRAMLAELRVLKGMLPVCCFCKKIRDESGNWHQMEFFITARSEATFTSTFCPDCAQEHYGELLNKKPNGARANES
jgi:hypothetical protein